MALAALANPTAVTWRDVAPTWRRRNEVATAAGLLRTWFGVAFLVARQFPGRCQAAWLESRVASSPLRHAAARAFASQDQGEPNKKHVSVKGPGKNPRRQGGKEEPTRPAAEGVSCGAG